MMLTTTRYHSVLRVSLLVLACVLVFDSGILTPVSKQLADGATQYLLSNVVGVFAGVAPNEINTITAALTERERELDAREAALKEREIEARNFSSGPTDDYSTFILSGILFIISVLIALNYVLDWRRMRAAV